MDICRKNFVGWVRDGWRKLQGFKINRLPNCENTEGQQKNHAQTNASACDSTAQKVRSEVNRKDAGLFSSALKDSNISREGYTGTFKFYMPQNLASSNTSAPINGLK